MHNELEQVVAVILAGQYAMIVPTTLKEARSSAVVGVSERAQVTRSTRR